MTETLAILSYMFSGPSTLLVVFFSGITTGLFIASYLISLKNRNQK